MNEIDKNIKEQIERAKKVIGLEIERNITAQELIAITTLILEVTKMIREDENLPKQEGEK